jgi:hypothetical protein
MNSTAIKKISWAGGLLVAIAVMLILFFCDPLRVPIYPQCLFHQMTGLDCPSCGSLRAMHALLHGNVTTALRFNAFLVLSLPLFAWVGFVFFRRRKMQSSFQIKPVWMWLYLVAFAVFAIARDLPVPLFAAFAP